MSEHFAVSPLSTHYYKKGQHSLVLHPHQEWSHYKNNVHKEGQGEASLRAHLASIGVKKRK